MTQPKRYDYIRLCMGYPDFEDRSRIIWRKWAGVKKGYAETNLFGYSHVFIIDVSKLIYKNQFWSPSIICKKVLTLNLKRKYWEEIKCFKKRFEYRENKPYWQKRLLTNKED